MSGFEWLPQLKSLWTAWFFLVFGVILIRILWPGNGKRLEAYGRIPLEDRSPAGDHSHD